MKNILSAFSDDCVVLTVWMNGSQTISSRLSHFAPSLIIHTMVPCDTLTPRALRVTAHAICQWVLVRFELAIFGSQAERSNHYTSVAAYILQCSFIPCVLVVLSITPLAIARGVIDSTPLGVFFSRKTPRLRLVFFLVYRLSHTSYNVFSRVLSQPPQVFFSQCMSLNPF